MFVAQVGFGVCLIVLSVLIILVSESFKGRGIADPHEVYTEDRDDSDYCGRCNSEIDTAEFVERHFRM